MQATSAAPVKGGFTVRRARPEDLDQAKQVIRDVLDQDLGGYDPHMHWDLERLKETYLDNPRYALFVAVDNQTGEVIGTTAVRPGGPKSPPHPKWLCDRYDPEKTAQLFRVYINPVHRRRGSARAMVEAARQFVADEGGYEVLYLHTNPSSPNAEAFWRSMATTEIYDARKDGSGMPTLHFEMSIPGREGRSPSP
jgi:RimJ/RimL family protein N-acetyltransferase